MDEDIRQLQKRFSELAARANGRGRYTYTQFLTLAEQDVLRKLERQLDAPFRWMGGYEAAERRLACFGREEDMGYPADSPICCLRIYPASRKFAGDLGHRDFLGSLMGLGIERRLLGHSRAPPPPAIITQYTLLSIKIRLFIHPIYNLYKYSK